MVNDTELPFHRIVQRNIENSTLADPNLESTAAMLIRIAWPKELVIQRRIDALCELILRPKQPQKRQIRSRKRKSMTDTLPIVSATTSASSSAAAVLVGSGGGSATSSVSMASKTPVLSSITPPPHVANRQYLSDIATDSEDEDEEEEEDEEMMRQKRARYEAYQRRVPTKPLKSQGFRHPLMHSPNTVMTPSESTMDTSSNLGEDDEMEDGEIAYSEDDDESGGNSSMLVESAFAF